MLDLAIKNARIYTMSEGPEPHPASRLGIKNGRFVELGTSEPADQELDAAGKIILPGFIDCHTHAVYAGNRMTEHALKLSGASYQEIAKSGGGIVSTMAAVRAASERQLVEESLPRLMALRDEGVTTVEIKSGYGLDTESELKMLSAVNMLGRKTSQRVVATFLGAHAVPAGWEKDRYLELVVEEMLPAVKKQGIAEAVDIFVESIAFDLADLEKLFIAAKQTGFKLRAHTDQLSNMGSTALAAKMGALSCDHLEYSEVEDIQAMRAQESVAVLLPGAYYFLNETSKPPIELFREFGVRMAVASDLNPGSSPLASLLAAMHMACTIFGLTPAEALLGVTSHAAAALGLQSEIGTIAPGRDADFGIWDIPAPEFLVYQLGGIQPSSVYIKGIKQ